MTTPIRHYTAGIVSSLALVGVCVAFPQWPQALGLAVGTRNGNRCTEVSAPSERCLVFKARIETKTRVIARLRAGELDLFEAAGWFAHVNREPTEFADRSWQNLPGASDEEKICRQVIHWTRGNLSQRIPDSELASLIEGLEARLAARLCDRGRVELPQWR